MEFLALALAAAVLVAIVAFVVARRRRLAAEDLAELAAARAADLAAAVRAAKERRIAAIQAEVAERYPHLRDLSVDDRTAAVRFCESLPAVKVFDAEIKALRATHGGTT